MINRHSRRGWSTSLLSKLSQVESLLFMPPFPILEPKNVKICTDIHISYMYIPRDGNTHMGREGGIRKEERKRRKRKIDNRYTDRKKWATIH